MSTIGIVLLLFAGFAQGTFGMGMKKQKPFSWEAFWLVYSLAGMLIFPVLWGWIGTPNFFQSIFTADGGVIFNAALLGFLWGIGGILFGMSVNYVGVSITNGVVMGLAGGLGAIIPLFGIKDVTADPSFIYIPIGVTIMVIGVALSAYSGLLREKEQGKAENSADKKKVKKGLVIVIISGVLSSLLNVGFETATPIVDNALALGATDSTAGMPGRTVVVFGGLLMNAGYSVYLLFKNKTWSDFSMVQAGSGKAFCWANITGLLWFLPLGLAGIVAVKIGALGNIITWPVMLALSLIFGNIWGYVAGEWKGARKSFSVMIWAAVVLITACLILTFKDSLPAL